MKFLPGYGYFIDAPDESGEVLLGGRCSLSGATSPNTGLPLTQFACARLYSESYGIPGWKKSEVHFLYSWKCKIHEGDFSYRYINNGLEVIEFRKGDDNYEGFPYENYPILFDEDRFRLRRITEEEQSIIFELNNPDTDPNFKFDNVLADQLSIPSHQFGGVPYLIDSEVPGKSCVICGREMPIVATIGNKSYAINEGFSGNDFVQVVYWACASCSVVSALNFSD